jgi:hypothetical protein
VTFKHALSRQADDGNIYVSSQRSTERVLASLTDGIAKHRRLEVNATQSGTGRPWERKCLGFRIHPQGKREAAPSSVERFKMKVRELWRSCQSQTSAELRDNWRAYIRGWWGYYRLAEERRNLFDRWVGYGDTSGAAAGNAGTPDEEGCANCEPWDGADAG